MIKVDWLAACSLLREVGVVSFISSKFANPPSQSVSLSGGLRNFSDPLDQQETSKIDQIHAINIIIHHLVWLYPQEGKH